VQQQQVGGGVVCLIFFHSLLCSATARLIPSFLSLSLDAKEKT